MGESDDDVTFDPADRDIDQLEVGLPLVRGLLGTWYRARLHGIDRVPDGPCLVVANHSGGVVAVDAPIFATEFARRFGTARPLHLVTAEAMMKGPLGKLLRRWGLMPGSPANVQHALAQGGTVMVFPGGDYDVVRPSSKRNVIDFDGRTGYVRTALDAGVPIVPVVYVGAHETQLFLTRGERLAKLLRFDKIARVKIFPVMFGFPFGFSLGGVLPLNLPLPSKIVGEVLDPIDPADFGDTPDVATIDEEVRGRMQAALDRLADDRRFPVIG